MRYILLCVVQAEKNNVLNGISEEDVYFYVLEARFIRFRAIAFKPSLASNRGEK